MEISGKVVNESICFMYWHFYSLRIPTIEPLAIFLFETVNYCTNLAEHEMIHPCDGTNTSLTKDVKRKIRKTRKISEGRRGDNGCSAQQRWPNLAHI